jgi:hypothetical protein
MPDVALAETHETPPPSIGEVVIEITNELALADARAKEAKSHRLVAGRKLVGLRRRVEAEGGDWWAFAEGRFGRSRKDIERLMRMASADDPEAAEANERAKNAEQHRNAHAKRNGADVRSKGKLALVTQSAQPDDIIVHPSGMIIHNGVPIDAHEITRFAEFASKVDPIMLHNSVKPHERKAFDEKVDAGFNLLARLRQLRAS